MTNSDSSGTELATGLVTEMLARLEAGGLRLAVAESLTGGLLADAFVSVPGASAVFAGAIVSYDTVLKHTLLGVDAELLREHGPVDAEVAKQMARGVREACGTDLGLSTTGVAGPDPDLQTGQKAGTVWVGVSSRRGERAIELHFAGGRAEIRSQAVQAALDALAGEIEAIL